MVVIEEEDVVTLQSSSTFPLRKQSECCWATDMQQGTIVVTVSVGRPHQPRIRLSGRHSRWECA